MPNALKHLPSSIIHLPSFIVSQKLEISHSCHLYFNNFPVSILIATNTYDDTFFLHCIKIPQYCCSLNTQEFGDFLVSSILVRLKDGQNFF